MNHHTHTTSRGSGITLVEMMVALAITTFIVLVINQLFNSVVATVARGTQAGELLQKARTMDEQLVFESELQINSDASVPGNWLSRMVGPAGRNGTSDPGGFFAIVQRVVDAPLTIEDGIRGETRLIRSDQLVFIYDQGSSLDAGTRRLPTMAPASARSFTGDERDSMYAEYVRLWYGHVLQVREDDDPTQFNMLNNNDYGPIDLGNTTGAGNPNVLAQDWVLGRHAMFLTDAAPVDAAAGDPSPIPYAPYVLVPLPGAPVNGITGVPGTPRLANGMSDVANITLQNLITNFYDPLPTSQAYQSQVLISMYTTMPLLTSAQPVGAGNMRAWDVSPTHTYFMGGVSDFIVEFAGDLANAHFTGPFDPTLIGKDGELDRDGQGRIKWYTAMGPNNPGRSGYDVDKPITYLAPAPSFYDANASDTIMTGPFNNPRTRGNAAFVWQHDGSPDFTSWPWMVRIRYRLHDRRGAFDGREVTNNSTGEAELEPGQWFETIIPVNYQNL